MPTNQPNSAPDAFPGARVDARDDAAAGAVLHDEQADMTPGGGGLGGATAGDPLGGSARAPDGISPNAPIDTGVDGGESHAAREAQVLAAADEAEAHPS